MKYSYRGGRGVRISHGAYLLPLGFKVNGMTRDKPMSGPFSHNEGKRTGPGCFSFYLRIVFVLGLAGFPGRLIPEDELKARCF